LVAQWVGRGLIFIVEPVSPSSSTEIAHNQGGPLKQTSETNKALILRTDFSDLAGWEAVQSAVNHPVSIFKAFVEFLSDPEFEGMTILQLLRLVPADSDRTFIFIVDRTTLSDPEHPILVLDLRDQPGRTFRVIPAEMWAVENNLSIANMDFAEFANAVDADGVFRGFPMH
jgi:hypothetical protein